MKTSLPAIYKIVSRIGLSATVASLALFAPSSYAGNIWDGGGSDGYWTSDTNWNDDVRPANGGAIFFDGNTRLASNNDYFTSFSGLTFLENAGAFILSGNSLIIGGSIVNESTYTQTIALNLALQNFREISGTADIHLAGTLTNWGGNRQLTNNLSSSTLRINNVALSNDATSRALTIISNGNTVVDGVISNGGTSSASSFTTGGRGTTTLSGANTYGGGTILSGGTTILDFRASGAPTNNILYHGVSAGTLTVTQAADNLGGAVTLQIDGTSGQSHAQHFSSLQIGRSNGLRGTAAHLVLNAGEEGGLSVSFSAASNPIQIQPGGTLNIVKAATDSVSITNGTTVNGILAGGSVAGTNPLITLNSRDWASLNGSKEVTAADYSTSFTTTSSSNLNVIHSGELAGTQANTLRFNEGAQRTVTLPGTYNIRGILITEAVGANSTLLTGGTLQLTGQFALFQYNTSADFEIASSLSGTGSFLKSGGGTVMLTGASLGYTGATYVNEGTYLFEGNLSSSRVSIGRQARFGGNGHSSGPIYVSSEGVIRAGTGTAFAEALAINGDVLLGDESVIELTLGATNGHSVLSREGGIWSFDGDQSFFLNILEGTETGLYTGVIIGLTGSEIGLASVDTWRVLNSDFEGTFSYDGAGGVNLMLTSIPEPSTMMLSMVGILFGIFQINRRRKG